MNSFLHHKLAKFSQNTHISLLVYSALPNNREQTMYTVTYSKFLPKMASIYEINTTPDYKLKKYNNNNYSPSAIGVYDDEVIYT